MALISSFFVISNNFNLGNALKPFLFIMIIVSIHFTINNAKKNENLLRNGLKNVYLEKFVWVQAALIIASFFEPILFKNVGEIIGIGVQEKHQRILNLTGFDEGNRAYSIFGNPNVAAKILVLTYSICQWVRKPSNYLKFSVILAIIATGSRAALLIFLFIEFTVIAVNKINKENIIRYSYLAVGLITLSYFMASKGFGFLDFRIFSFSSADNSLLYKLLVINDVLVHGNAANYVGQTVDNDLVYMVVNYNLLYVVLLILTIAMVFIIGGLKTYSYVYFYVLSGSLLFSAVNVSLIFLIYLIVIYEHRNIWTKDFRSSLELCDKRT